MAEVHFSTCDTHMEPFSKRAWVRFEDYDTLRKLCGAMLEALIIVNNQLLEFNNETDDVGRACYLAELIIPHAQEVLNEQYNYPTQASGIIKPVTMAENYTPCWKRLVLMVDPSGKFHAIGGEEDSKPGDESHYPAVDWLTERVSRAEAERDALRVKAMWLTEGTTPEEWQAITDVAASNMDGQITVSSKTVLKLLHQLAERDAAIARLEALVVELGGVGELPIAARDQGEKEGV